MYLIFAIEGGKLKAENGKPQQQPNEPRRNKSATGEHIAVGTAWVDPA
jgi:hypothetical protein